MYLCIKLSVFFEDPFWVGVFEKTNNDEYQVARYVFGAEPKDYDIYEFVLSEYYSLRFSNPMAVENQVEKRVKLKRLQKRIGNELENIRTGTKAQIAMKLQYEANKTENKSSERELKEEAERRKFELKQMKRKEKHKGH